MYMYASMFGHSFSALNNNIYLRTPHQASAIPIRRCEPG